MVGFDDIKLNINTKGMDVLYEGSIFLFGTNIVKITIGDLLNVFIKNEENPDGDPNLNMSGYNDKLDVNFHNLSKFSGVFAFEPARVGTINKRELFLSFFLNSKVKNGDSYIYLLHYCFYLGGEDENND